MENKPEPRACGTCRNVATAALRAQSHKLDRSRWEKFCYLCGGATYLSGDVCFSGTYFVGISEFDFCPVCGKPLTEEAWAELERRIGGPDETD